MRLCINYKVQIDLSFFSYVKGIESFESQTQQKTWLILITIRKG